MRDQSFIVVLLTVLGLSGLLVVGGGQPNAPAKETARTGTTAGSVALEAPCDGDRAFAPLCGFFNATTADAAVERFRAADSRVLIVAVPDPLDSEVGYAFDPRLETIRMAAVAAGYQPDRFYLPWSRGAAKDEGASKLPDVTATVSTRDNRVDVRSAPRAAPSPPEHRTTPGVLLFRGPPAAQDVLAAPSLLLVLLVGETPTFGSDPRVLDKALAMAAGLADPSRNRDARGPVLPVVAPMYSGAVEPLRQASLAWTGGDGKLRLRFVSGTATSDTQLLRLAMCAGADHSSSECRNEVSSYQDTIGPLLQGLLTFLDARTVRPAGSLDWSGLTRAAPRIALLHEADTSFGASITDPFGPPTSPRPRPDILFLPYPLHISQLWGAYLREGRTRTDPATQLDAAARQALTLFPEAPERPIDVPQSMFPATAANVADRLLANLLHRVALSGVDYVGLVGSNISDTIFLAGLVRQHAPDAQLFTIGSDVLLTHPQHRRDLQGLWMVSSHFPQSRRVVRETTQRWTQLASSYDAGLYHATIDATCSLLPSGSCEPAETPRWTPAGGQQTNGMLWLTAVGRGSVWPVDVLQGNLTSWGIPGPPRERAPIGHPGPFMVLLAAFSLFGLYAWVVYVRPAHCESLRTLGWLSQLHANGGSGGLAAPAFWIALFAAGAFPTVVLGWRWPWSSLADQGILVLCAAVVAAVLHAAARALYRERPATPRQAVGWVALLGIFVALAAWTLVRLAALALPGCETPSFGALIHSQRAVHLGSGLSPVFPWAVLAAGALVLSYAMLRRGRLAAATPRVTGFKRGIPLLRAHVRRIVTSISPHTLVTAPSIAAGIVAVFTLVMLGLTGVVTMDSPCFGIALVLGFTLLLSGTAYLLVSALVVWNGLRRLLRALAWGPLSDAFDRVPQEFSRTLGLRWGAEPGRASELRYELDQLQMVVTLAEREEPAAGWGVPLPASGLVEWSTTHEKIVRELDKVAADGRWRFTYETDAQGTLSALSGDIVRDFLVHKWSDEPLRTEPHADVKDRPLLAKREEQVVDFLTAYRRRAIPLVRVAEEFVAVEITRFVAWVFSHLKNLLVSAILVVVAAMLAAAAYPFRPQHTLIEWIGLGVAAVLATTVVVIIQVERNEVLSRIANRTPNKVDFDTTFFAQMFLYLVLPIAALLVTQFPALSDPLSGLLAGVGRR